MQHIKHVFFDLDHTLWDFEKNSALAYAKIFEENEIHLDLQKFFNYYKNINIRYWKLYRTNKISKEAMRYRRLNDVFRVMNRPASSNLINHLSKEYMSCLSTFPHLFEGTFETLEYLSSKYTLHILTNGFEEIQTKKIKNSRIDVFFETIICSDQAGFKKPDLKMFDFAMKKASAKKENSIMIGDSWEADILGADKYGMDVIYCNFEKEKIKKPFKSITSLKELKEYL